MDVLEQRWVTDITGALIVQVLLDYLNIWERVRAITLQSSAQDKVIRKWTADQCFTTASAYRAFFIGQYAIPGVKILWKSRAPAKCKFFLWLALHGRCRTASRRKRHNLQDDDSCALHEQEPETINHLIIGCSYSRQVWYCIFSRTGWQPRALSITDTTLADWWITSRKHVNKADRKFYDSAVVLITWSIWLERNARTFNREEKTVPLLVRKITEEAWVRISGRYRNLLPLVQNEPPPDDVATWSQNGVYVIS